MPSVRLPVGVDLPDKDTKGAEPPQNLRRDCSARSRRP